MQSIITNPEPLLEKIRETGYRGVVGFDSIFSQQENVFFGTMKKSL